MVPIRRAPIGSILALGLALTTLILMRPPLASGRAGGSRRLSTDSLLTCTPVVDSMDILLSSLVLDRSTGTAWGAADAALYRVEAGGHWGTFTQWFGSPIRGIHFMKNGTMFLSTDQTEAAFSPCSLYRSSDGGHQFALVKTFDVSTAAGWSMAHDRDDNLYVGEYGPTGRGESKRVWKSSDYGNTWSVVFYAPDSIGVHIHRVAVDPYTNFVWVTHGDSPDGIYVSRDEGATWSFVRVSQATAVAFTPEAIYWGEDVVQGIVTRYDRATGEFTRILNASTLGPYGGSVYDMTVGNSGEIYVPMKKYPEETHKPTIWVIDGFQARLLEEVQVPATGASHISAPDRLGYMYLTSHRIAEPCPDDQAPAPPAPFAGLYTYGATLLHWGNNLEPDFLEYRLYRSMTGDFAPEATILVAAKGDTGYTDPGPSGRYYRLTAVDRSGNESAFVSFPTPILDAPNSDAARLTLDVAPNPTGPSRVTVAGTLPSSERARLEAFDIVGRRVFHRALADRGAGRFLVTLSEGRALAPGTYLIRLTQGARTVTRRLVVLP